MEARPPRLVEAIIGRLIPSVCRETVLGDMYERYISTSQYIADAVATLPFILASQIRRTSPIKLILAEVFVLYVAFAGASLPAGPAYIYDHSAWLPLGLAIASVLLALLILDAYTDPRIQSRLTKYRNVILALTCAFYAQAAIALVKPQWILPMWVLLLGDILSSPMLLVVRKHYKKAGPRTVTSGGMTMPLDELRLQSEHEHRSAWWLNLVWLAAAFMVRVTIWNSLPRWGQAVLVVFFLVFFLAAKIDDIDKSDKKL